jgi:RsiW-degrading membrane proteinase PrsW (M82 family)
MRRKGSKQASGLLPNVNTVFAAQTTVTMNALEDFSEKSRTDENWLYIFLLVIVACVAFIFYSKAPFHENLTRRTP